MSEEKIKFAVIGCGHIGKRHAEMIRRHPEADLVALIDVKNPAELDIEHFGVPFFNSIEEMMENGTQVDVVNICTPNGFHAQQAVTSLEHNCHVVCEKPMGLNTENCRNVISKADESGKLVFCVMQNRYSPPSAWIKDLVQSGKLGKLYMMHLNCFWNRDDRYYLRSDWKGTEELDGGTLFTQFSHFIDIMYWLFGSIEDISAQFNDFMHEHSTDFEDSGVVNFNFKEGGMGSLAYSTAVWAENLESSITIIAEKGSVKIGGQYMAEVEYCNVDGYEMPVLPEPNPANDYGHYKGSAANHHYVIENVVDTLKGRSTATTNAHEGLAVVDIIERIYALRKKNYVRRVKEQG